MRPEPFGSGRVQRLAALPQNCPTPLLNLTLVAAGREGHLGKCDLLLACLNRNQRTLNRSL